MVSFLLLLFLVVIRMILNVVCELYIVDDVVFFNIEIFVILIGFIWFSWLLVEIILLMIINGEFLFNEVVLWIL